MKLRHNNHPVLPKYMKMSLHIPHLACPRQFAASHCTIPLKNKNNYSDTKRRYARTQRFEKVSSNNRLKRISCKTALVTQVHENEFAYSASRLHAAIRRFTLNNPIENYSDAKKNYARTQKIEQVFSNNRLKRMPCKTASVTTHEMASCTHKKLNKWALNNYIARCHQKSTSSLSYESPCVSARGQTRVRMT